MDDPTKYPLLLASVFDMQSLIVAIPDVNTLLTLEPEELGAKILFLLRKRRPDPSGFHLGNLILELWPQNYLPNNASQYPRDRVAEVNQAVSEAWAWLTAQGLLIPAPGAGDWRLISRRAARIATEAEFADYKIARLLPKEILHLRIADRVWGAFMRGEYDGAVFQAMKAVEVAVREASGLGEELVGVKLIRAAFKPEDGPLTDMQAEGGEKQARMELFASAMGSYKNPQSHRDVNPDDPLEALEIIYFANHLLRIVDARAWPQSHLSCSSLMRRHRSASSASSPRTSATKIPAAPITKPPAGFRIGARAGKCGSWPT